MVSGRTFRPLFRNETKWASVSQPGSFLRASFALFGPVADEITCAVKRRSATKDHISMSEERPHEECGSYEQGNIRKKTIEWHRRKLSLSFSVGN
jgi:hypothetical protein